VTPRSKGTHAESAVVGYLVTHGFPEAERRALNGTKDRGDIAGIPGVVIEVKAHATFELASWLDEALREGANANAPISVVWHKRRSKGDPGQWYVTMTGATFVKLIAEEGT
jgi:hypothetical protein